MLDFQKEVFPGVFIEKFASRIQALAPSVSVKQRKIRTTDSSISVGIFGDHWTPIRSSHEIMGGGFSGMHEPTLNTYSVLAQGLIIDTEEERGLAYHYSLANMLRVTLAWDEELGVSLSQSSAVITGNVREVLRKWKIEEQRYYSAELGSSKWAYMSVTKIDLETETRKMV